MALLDGIDTAEDNNDMLHFRSLMNDYHLRELSGKIKSVLHAKAQQGQFLGGYAPYGYQKSSEDRHRLVVDTYSSKVVQTIYAMREQGVAYGKIAAYLNNEGILSPFAYWHSLHGKGECKHSMTVASQEVAQLITIFTSLSKKGKTEMPKRIKEYKDMEDARKDKAPSSKESAG